ncbi:hypothetical protein BD414DRAFT_482155 [Trametes punicea]|nr:hypothetical protein BD414DRAFT_482155 [Trametes punicea]
MFALPAYKRAASVALRYTQATPASLSHRHTHINLPNPLHARVQRAAMSTAIVLPQLPDWVQQHVKALYSAKTEEAFDTAFDSFISQHAQIRLNGKNVGRDEYKKAIRGEITGDVSADITFNGVVSVAAEGGADTIGTGSVGLFFKAVVYGRFFVFAAPESSTVNSSLNVVVTEDVPRPHQFGRGGAFDGRRVTVLDEVLTDVPDKIVPPTAGHA